MEIRSGIAQVNQAQLYYEEAGQGFPVVMVHAGIADRRMWDDQFEAFAQNYRVIRYDCRGYGKSPMVPGPYSHHADLHALLQGLGVEQAYLMGCSQGGEIVIDFALEHPEMTAAVIAVAASVSGFEYEGEPPPLIVELEEALGRGDLDQAAGLAVRIWLDSPRRKPEKVDPALREKVREMSRIAFQTPRNAGKLRPLQPPAVERLENLTVPVLTVIGELDSRVIKDIADLLSTLPNARKVILTDTAHLPNMERPEAFNQIVLSFLAGTKNPTA